MQEYKHWASALEIGDRCIATIRHATDGSKNIHNASVIVAMQKHHSSSIIASYNHGLIEIPYNELKKIPERRLIDDEQPEPQN